MALAFGITQEGHPGGCRTAGKPGVACMTSSVCFSVPSEIDQMIKLAHGCGELYMPPSRSASCPQIASSSPAKWPVYSASVCWIYVALARHGSGSSHLNGFELLQCWQHGLQELRRRVGPPMAALIPAAPCPSLPSLLPPAPPSPPWIACVSFLP